MARQKPRKVKRQEQLKEEVDVEFVSNRHRRVTKVFVNGFGFIRDRRQNGSWNCEHKNSKSCTATAFTIEQPDGSHTLQTFDEGHSHPTDPKAKTSVTKTNRCAYIMKNTSASKSGTSERTAKNPAKPISKTSQAVRHDLRKLRHHIDEDPEFSDEETSDETSSDYEDEENEQDLGPGPDVEFVENLVGNKKLYVNGYGFYKHSIRSNITYWHCEFKKSLKCPVGVTTTETEDGATRTRVFEVAHNHPLDTTRREKLLNRKAQKSKDAEVRLDQGESVTKNSRAKKKKWQDFEFFALQTVKEETAEEAVVIEEDDTGLLCRLCCKSNAIPTTSVNDDVIVDFLNVTSLILSDHRSLSIHICQQCYGQAKACVDFVHNIQKSQRSFSFNRALDDKPRVTAQDALNKLKRIGCIDIRKVESKPRLADEQFNDSMNDTRLPTLPKKRLQKSAEKPKRQEASVDHDVDDGYQLERVSEKKPTSSLKKRKISINEESDDDTQDLTKPKATPLIIGPPVKYTCSRCRFSYTNMRDLLTHMKDCKIKPKCKICGKVFDAISTLQRHLEKHEKTVVVFCDHCGLEFKNTYQLNVHIGNTHSSIFRCSKCSKVLPSHLELLTHFKKHDSEV